MLIPKLINFSNYIASYDGDYKEYGMGKVYEYKGTQKDENLINILFMMILSWKDNCSLNAEKLEALEKMFELKNNNFNFSFIMMIDNLLDGDMLVENSIINKVSFLERLLISKEYNKADAFVLKVGILCNDLFNISNDCLSKRLREIYNIRSKLVHGDGNDIIDNIDYYKKIFSKEIKKGQSKAETKLQVLWCVDTILNSFLIRVLNIYLNRPNLCEFIKKN